MKKNIVIITSVIFVILLLILFGLLQLKTEKKVFKLSSSKSVKTTIKRQDVVSGEYYFSLKHDGMTRYYKIYIPKRYNMKEKRPLVIVLHGGGGNIKKVSNYFHFNPIADKYNFIVVYPEGTGKKVKGVLFGTWNAGNCCGSAVDNNVDDVGFIKKVIQDAERRFNVDDKRIFVTGMSNGAMMSYRLACDLSDKIAAVAPVASIGQYDECKPSRTVPILHIHSVNDPCAPYYGCKKCQSCIALYFSKIGIPTKNNISENVSSVPFFIDNWRKQNGCLNEKRIYYQGEDIKCQSFEKCKNDADVVLCTMKNVGHVWPGNSMYSPSACQSNPDGRLCRLWGKIVGPLNPNVRINDLIWTFFENHPMK